MQKKSPALVHVLYFINHWAHEMLYFSIRLRCQISQHQYSCHMQCHSAAYEHADGRYLPLRMCMSSHLLIMLEVACDCGTCSVTKSDPLRSSFKVSTGMLFPMGICTASSKIKDIIWLYADHRQMVHKADHNDLAMISGLSQTPLWVSRCRF